MKKESYKDLLALLLRVYNHTVQTYYYFPEVIICGNHRMEPQEFETIKKEDYVVAYYKDSFGKIYHLSKKGERFLFEHNCKRRRKNNDINPASETQYSFQFA